MELKTRKIIIFSESESYLKWNFPLNAKFTLKEKGNFKGPQICATLNDNCITDSLYEFLLDLDI